MNSTATLKQLKAMVTGKENFGLKKILISNTIEGLTFTSTDLDVFTSWKTDNSDTETWVRTVDYKTLLGVVQVLPKQSEFSIHYADNKIGILSEIGMVELDSEDRNTFPAIPEVSVASSTISSQVIDSMIELIPFAGGKDEIRQSLQSIHYNPERDELVATDGHYMGIIKNVPKLHNATLNIPAIDIKKLAKMLKASDKSHKEIEVTTDTKDSLPSATLIQFSKPDFSMTIRLNTEPYPPYAKVMPQHNSLHLNLDAQVIKNIPLALLNQDTKQILLTPENGIVTFAGVSDTTKWSRKAGTTELNEVMALNADLLQAVAKFIGTETLKFKVKDPTTSLLAETPEKIALLMPVRIA